MKKYKDCIGYVEGINPSSANKVSFSIIELFGETPVHPDKFEKLDPRLKWFGICKESKSFCVGCGTLTQHIPYEHHPECGHFLSKDYCQEMEDHKSKCMGTEKQRSHPLEVELKNGKLLISIGIDNLSYAVSSSDNWNKEDKIVDTYEFARDIITAITDSDEGDGTIYHMFDMAAIEAAEQGGLGVEFGEDNND